MCPSRSVRMLPISPAPPVMSTLRFPDDDIAAVPPQIFGHCRLLFHATHCLRIGATALIW